MRRQHHHRQQRKHPDVPRRRHRCFPRDVSWRLSAFWGPSEDARCGERRGKRWASEREETGTDSRKKGTDDAASDALPPAKDDRRPIQLGQPFVAL